MKRKFKKRRKNRKKEMDATKFWVFIVCALIVGLTFGVVFSGSITSNILRKWTEDWEVKQVPTACSDSDNGFNLGERGTCSDTYGNHVDRCSMKGEERVLYEYSCINNECVSQELYCEDFGYQGQGSSDPCYFGACHNR